jgi:ABC-2 type transport system ATP-binding protein
VLHIKNLRYQHRGNWLGKPRETLKGISLDINTGESFGFLGHNGAGKTTTIKCILGLLNPTSGEVLINSIPSNQPYARQYVGYVAEQPYFYDHLTVRESLTMFATLANVPREFRQTRIAHVLERLGIGNRSHVTLRTLSKGLIQRVAMAQAILAEPRLLILDEPFSGLDPMGRREFREILNEERAKGTTLFICTHVLNDIERLCDRVSILVEGELRGVFNVSALPSKCTSYQLEVVGSLQSTDIFSSKSIKRTERSGVTLFEFDNRTSAESALRAALNGGLEISSYGSNKGNLEDLFSEIVQQEKSRAGIEDQS